MTNKINDLIDKINTQKAIIEENIIKINSQKIVIEELNIQINSQNAVIEENLAKVEELTKFKYELEDEIIKYVTSRSWTVTRPFRQFSRIIRGKK